MAHPWVGKLNESEFDVICLFNLNYSVGVCRNRSILYLPLFALIISVETSGKADV